MEVSGGIEIDKSPDFIEVSRTIDLLKHDENHFFSRSRSVAGG